MNQQPDFKAAFVHFVAFYEMLDDIASIRYSIS